MRPCDLLKAMADESRLRLLVVLAEEELCVRQLEAVLQLHRLNVVGCDINELSPHYDPSGSSTAVACKITREILLQIAP